MRMFQQMLMMQQQMIQMAQIIDQLKGTNLATQMSAGAAEGATPVPAAGSTANAEDTEALGGAEAKESTNTKKARQRVAKSTNPT